MDRKLAAFRGTLLGLAVGDALGYTVDNRTWRQIQEDYGPGGLLGYDLVNGYADITSYTQMAAFTCNGLLLALTRGQMMGKMAPLVKYVGLSSREWAASQRPWGRPEKTFCWLLTQPEICRRHCMDTRMLDTLSRESLGSLEEPKNSFVSPGGLTAAVGVGMFVHVARLPQDELDRLGAETVALTHGSPMAFLSGAALTHMISLCLKMPDMSLKALVGDTVSSLKSQFGHQYSQCFEVCSLLTIALSLADDRTSPPVKAMERLRCENAGQVLAGAVYAIARGQEAFDESLIIAVNHSGRSSAVGAAAGALLGARLGENALPGFYLECLEPEQLLRELADDMYRGCPMEKGSKLFDLDWDRKYIHAGR